MQPDGGTSLPAGAANRGRTVTAKLLPAGAGLWLDGRPVAEVDMPSAEPNRLPAIALARLVEGGELTAEAIVRSCLDRIAEREPVIRAWTHLAAEPALAAARASDRGSTPGLLKGVPFGGTDIFDPANLPTGYG